MIRFCNRLVVPKIVTCHVTKGRRGTLETARELVEQVGDGVAVARLHAQRDGLTHDGAVDQGLIADSHAKASA